MDWNRVEGNWKQMKGKVKEKWGKLTDDDLSVIKGARDQLERQNSGTLPESSGPKGSGRVVQFADVVIWIYRINKEPLAP